MREILFRALDAETGEIVYGVPVKCVCCDNYLMAFSELGEDGEGQVTIAPIDASTIAEYTGSKDLNGERIFEGDFVTIPADEYHDKCLAEVYWDETEWALRGGFGSDGFGWHYAGKERLNVTLDAKEGGAE